MHDPTGFVERLEQAAAAIAGGEGPSDVFRHLLDGFAECAPRTALLLVRQGALRGWGSVGYPAEAAARLRSVSLEPGAAWPARVASPDAPDRAYRGPDDVEALRLEDATRREALASALRVGGRTIAVVVSERDPGEHPWSPPGMAVLLTVARLRLEFDLARRRLKRSEPDGARAETAADPTPPTAPAESISPPAPPAPASVEPVKAEDVRALEPSDGPAVAPTAEDEAARRFARLVATDIRLYNEEDVLAGRRQGDLHRRLKEHLDRGRDTFARRFPSLGDRGDRILHEAFVQVLAGGNAGLLPDTATAATEPGAGR